MSFGVKLFGALSKKGTTEVVEQIASKGKTFTKLPNRFFQGWTQVGYVERAPRANTVEELRSSIMAYAQENPEIAEFAKHLNEMSPRHLGVAQDIIDLSHGTVMSGGWTNINLRQLCSNGSGRTIMGDLLHRLPEIGKRNPEALNTLEKVFNYSDHTNAKYFLTQMLGGNKVEEMAHLAPQLKAFQEVVPTVAKETITGPSLIDFTNNKQFFDCFRILAAQDSKPANVRLLPQIVENINRICKRTSPKCDISSIRIADTERLAENVKVMPQVLENAERQGKNIDVGAFLEHNINLT